MKQEPWINESQEHYLPVWPHIFLFAMQQILLVDLNLILQLNCFLVEIYNIVVMLGVSKGHTNLHS